LALEEDSHRMAARVEDRRLKRGAGMGIKCLNLVLAILGGVSPVATNYALNSHRGVPGLVVDLGLLIFTLRLSVVFIPIGIVAGLGLAFVVHLGWNRVAPRRRRRSVRPPGPSPDK
jgi:hypothetical protein